MYVVEYKPGNLIKLERNTPLYSVSGVVGTVSKGTCVVILSVNVDKYDVHINVITSIGVGHFLQYNSNMTYNLSAQKLFMFVESNNKIA